MARQEQVLMEVGLVPVRESKLLKEGKRAQGIPAPPPSPPSPPKGTSRQETPKDQDVFSAREGNKVSPLKKGAAGAGDRPAEPAAPEEPAGISPSEQDSEVPDAETSREGQTGAAEVVDAEPKADSVAETDSAVEPVSVSPPTPAAAELEAARPTVVASPPVTLAENESQEIEEDEGIHSHDGSDLSDNMSEGSDDSGLHGARPAPQDAAPKSGKAGLAAKVTEGEFVCIFCDRSFRKEKDYSKHLNRHLVNVYFLEEAAEEQEGQEEQEEQE